MSRAVRRALRPFVVATLLVAVVTSAMAVVRTETDANDTRGELDVRSMRFTWEPGAAPRWTIVTFSTWPESAVWDRGYLYVEIDTHAGEGADDYVLIRSDGRRMIGSLFRVGKHRDRYVRRVPVDRADEISVEVAIPWSELSIGPSRETIGWWVRTSFSSGACVKPCLDRAPDDGALEEFVPGASPPPDPNPNPND